MIDVSIPSDLYLSLHDTDTGSACSEISSATYERARISFDDGWYPDPDVDCAVPYFLPEVIVLALGVLVTLAALMIAAAQRVRRGKA